MAGRCAGTTLGPEDGAGGPETRGRLQTDVEQFALLAGAMRCG